MTKQLAVEVAMAFPGVNGDSGTWCTFYVKIDDPIGTCVPDECELEIFSRAIEALNSESISFRNAGIHRWLYSYCELEDKEEENV